MNDDENHKLLVELLKRAASKERQEEEEAQQAHRQAVFKAMHEAAARAAQAKPLDVAASTQDEDEKQRAIEAFRRRIANQKKEWERLAGFAGAQVRYAQRSGQEHTTLAPYTLETLCPAGWPAPLCEKVSHVSEHAAPPRGGAYARFEIQKLLHLTPSGVSVPVDAAMLKDVRKKLAKHKTVVAVVDYDRNGNLEVECYADDSWARLA